MPTIQIAHIREQGQDMIIVPLDPDFEFKPEVDKDDILTELQLRARSAGLAGRVVPVWDSGSGRMSFIAPRQWHPLFQSLSLFHIRRVLNRTLSW